VPVPLPQEKPSNPDGRGMLGRTEAACASAGAGAGAGTGAGACVAIAIGCAKPDCKYEDC